MKKLVATITAVGVLTVGAASAAAATESDPGGSQPSAADHPRHGHRPVRVALHLAARAAADALGVSVPDLRTAVRDGQSIAAFAESRGVDPASVEDAIVAALERAVDGAVERGRVDEARAAKVKERIPTFADRIVHHVPRHADARGPRST